MHGSRHPRSEISDLQLLKENVTDTNPAQPDTEAIFDLLTTPIPPSIGNVTKIPQTQG
jgi:hypothetical protein